MPPGKASPSDYWLIYYITYPLKSEPAQQKWFSQTIHTYKPYWYAWVVIFSEAHFECHDILMLGKSPTKWRQRPDMTIAVDWDVKQQFK